MTQVQIDSLLRCPYCHDAIVGPGRKNGCESCFAWHHASCMSELGRCGNCGAVTREPANQPTLASERARLNALLETSCAYQSCRSIDTIRVNRDYLCPRHAESQVMILGVVGVSFCLSSLAPLWQLVAYTGKSLPLQDVVIMTAVSLFLIMLGSVVLRWRTKIRSILSEAERRASLELPIEGSPEVSEQVSSKGKKLSA